MMIGREILVAIAMTAAMMDTTYSTPSKKGSITYCKTKAQTKKRIKAKAAKKARKKNR